VNAATIPLHLALGPDAVESIRKDQNGLSADVQSWETLSQGTDLM
jgi:hypothetical protein